MTRFEMSQKFAEMLEKERVKMGLSQKQMAQKLDVSLSTYKRIVSGTTDKIDLYLLYKLYLATGKLAYEFTDFSDPVLELKKKIAHLSPSQMSFIESLIDFETAYAASHEDAEDYVTVYIPTGNMEDGMIYDSVNIEKVNIAGYRRKYGNEITCGIRVTSNHLHPVYLKNDILLISKRPIRDGDAGIFLNTETGCIYLRKFYQTNPCRLEPINGYGETFYV
ncbi:MAG: helix-turn-helix transcriptional regulator, partial [Lachnospiraceae bacterium]|nr:helix-turn-helix transcriptional regulator [Candidatus Equihabitans merdae]